MQVEEYPFHQIHTKKEAKKSLVHLLQNAHAGEKAAANAYWGHAHSIFVTDGQERAEILKIYSEEIHHRESLKKLLTQLESQPRILREWAMWCIGAMIAIFSFIGTWFIPMYGAGRLESTNIGEYEIAARLAFLAGEKQMADELLTFGEIEWDHEAYFRKKTQGHFLAQWVPLWKAPKVRQEILNSFNEFKTLNEKL